MQNLFITLILIVFCALPAKPVDYYSYNECRGSSMPYIDPTGPLVAPDSLRVVMVNHVGRHGARYPSSSKNAERVRKLLRSARDKRTITPQGRRLLALTERVIRESNGRWGALDTLGKAEQRWLAARMSGNFSKLLNNKEVTISAVSSYVPRCVMSMYEFTHQLARQNRRSEIYTSSGRQNDVLMRFFELDSAYIAFENSDVVKKTVRDFAETRLSGNMLTRFVGVGYPMKDVDLYDNLMAIYSVLAGTAAMELKCDISQYFNLGEFNALWSVFNLKQYLAHSASSLSELPATSAKPLLVNLIEATDSFIAGADMAPVQLRFGHAETIMPLLALMHVPGCRFITDDFAEVAEGWRDFVIVPMAANFRLILFRSKSGGYYVRADLNEKPVELVPDKPVYVPWEEAKAYLELRAGSM